MVRTYTDIYLLDYVTVATLILLSFHCTATYMICVTYLKVNTVIKNKTYTV